MRLSALAALMILTTVVLSACKQETVAALDDRSSQYYGRSHIAPRYASASASMMSHRAMPSAYVPVRPVSNTTERIVSNDVVTSTDLPPPPALVRATAARTTELAKIAPAASSSVMASSTDRNGWDWPVEGKVVKDFAMQGEGIIIAAKKDAPIRAASGGEVAYVGTQLKDYGNLVIVRHPNGDMTSYAHASEILVSKGDKIKQGDVLGYVGQTGRAPQPQLHFAVRSGSRTIDPMTRLPRSVASN